MFIKKIVKLATLLLVLCSTITAAHAVRLAVPHNEWVQLSSPREGLRVWDVLPIDLALSDDWVMWDYNPKTHAYEELERDHFFSSGKGVWFLQYTGQTITIDTNDIEGPSPQIGSEYITYTRGNFSRYSMQGNPRDYNIKIDNIWFHTRDGSLSFSEATGGVHHNGSLATWNGRKETYDILGVGDYLKVFHGYWIRTLGTAPQISVSYDGFVP